MSNEGENLGTATIYLTVDKSSMDATIGKAKLELAGMGAEASKQYEAASAGQRKLAESLVRQAELIGKTRAEQIAYNAQLKIGGALGDEIAARAIANAQATTAAQQEAVTAAKATADAQAEMAAAEDARFKQIARDAMAEVEARQTITAATMEQARANAALAEAQGVGAPARSGSYMGALDAAITQQQIADYAALDAVMTKKVATTEEVAAAEAALDRLQAEGMLSSEELAAAFVALDAATALDTKALQSNTVANVENAAAKRLNSRTTYSLSALFTDAATGQFSRSRRELAALANETGLLGKLMTPTGLAIGGVAAALATLGIATVKGEQEFSDFSKTMLATGNYAGITFTQYRALAESLSGSGTSIGHAKDALSALAQSGKFTGEQLGQAAQAAIDMANLTGESTKQAVAAITKLGEDPVKAIEALDDQYHFLSTATLQRIAELEDQGNKQDAANLAEETYAKALRTRAADMENTLGTLQRAWQALGGFASWAWDQMEGLGRPQSKLDNLTSQLEKLENQRDAMLAVTKTGHATFDQAGNLPANVASGYHGALFGGGFSEEALANAKRDLAAINAQVAILHQQVTVEQNNANAATQAKADAAELKQAGNQGVETLAKLGISLDGVKTKADKVKEAATALWNVWRAGGQLPKGVSFTGPIADVPVGPGWDAIKAKLLSEGRGHARKDDSEKLRQMGLDDIQKDIATAGKEADAQARSAAEVKAFTDNLNSQLQTRKQVLALQVQAIGMGSKEAQQQQELLSIQQQYEQKQAQLDREHADQSRGLTDEAYAQESAALKAHYEDDIALTKQHYVEMDAEEANWAAGMKSGLEDWAASAGNAAAQMHNFIGSALDKAADALATFVTTGKLDFKDLVRSILAELAKLELEAVMAKIVMSMVGGGYADGGVFGQTGEIPQFASGGVFTNSIVNRPTLFKFANGTGLMGEAGEEAIMPLTRLSGGRLGVAATGAGAGGSSNIININTSVVVDQSGARSSTSSDSSDSAARQLGAMIETKAKEVVSRAIQPGGILWRHGVGQAA